MSIVRVIIYAVVILVIGVILAAILLRKAEKKKHRFEKFMVGVYVPLTLWSVFYYLWCFASPTNRIRTTANAASTSHRQIMDKPVPSRHQK